MGDDIGDDLAVFLGPGAGGDPFLIGQEGGPFLLALECRKRDHRRTDFLATHFHRKPNDVHVYDMVLNTSLLGEERCADMIAAAAKAKMSAVVGMD